MTESRSATGSSGSGILPILSIADETGLGLGATVGGLRSARSMAAGLFACAVRRSHQAVAVCRLAGRQQANDTIPGIILLSL
eukprot:scaffold12001_cov116-Isochrysis_galbana.AAC.23